MLINLLHLGWKEENAISDCEVPQKCKALYDAKSSFCLPVESRSIKMARKVTSLPGPQPYSSSYNLQLKPVYSKQQET